MARLASLAVLAGLLAFGSGCSSVRGSAVATDPSVAPYTGEVKVVALEVPEGMREVGIVEVSGRPVLEELVAKFAEKTAEVGGSLGKVDSIRTKFEWKTQTRTESYSCGTSQSPSTCTRTVTENVEVATTSLVGRAFR